MADGKSKNRRATTAWSYIGGMEIERSWKYMKRGEARRSSAGRLSGFGCSIHASFFKLPCWKVGMQGVTRGHRGNVALERRTNATGGSQP